MRVEKNDILDLNCLIVSFYQLQPHCVTEESYGSKKSLIQSYKNIYLTGFNQCTIAQIRIKLTAEVDIEICSK